jgi:hypothetical protein
MNIRKADVIVGIIMASAVLIIVGGIYNAHRPENKAALPLAPSSTPNPPTVQQRQAQEKGKQGREYRNGARSTLESRLLSAGYDVQVGFVGQEGSDNRHLLIVGEPVNRVFIHQLIGAGFRRSLQRDGFTKITFMKSRTDWVGEYDVATNTVNTISQ